MWLINDEGCGNDDCDGDNIIRSFFPWKKYRLSRTFGNVYASIATCIFHVLTRHAVFIVN